MRRQVTVRLAAAEFPDKRRRSTTTALRALYAPAITSVEDQVPTRGGRLLHSPAERLRSAAQSGTRCDFSLGRLIVG